MWPHRWHSLAPDQIEHLTRSGRFAEAFQMITERIRTVMSTGDERQRNIMRQLLENDFRIPPGLADKLRRERVDFVSLLNRSSKVDEARGESKVSASQQFSHLKHLMGTFFTDFGSTFQAPYAAVMTMTTNMLGRVLDVWQKVPRLARETLHWGLGLIIAAKTLGKLGLVASTFVTATAESSVFMTSLAASSPLVLITGTSLRHIFYL